MPEKTVSTLQLFGGHKVLDFTNTVDLRGARFGPDVLERYDDLLHWGVRLGVVEPAEADTLCHVSTRRGDAALARAKALREAIYRVIAAPPANPADLQLLQCEVVAAERARVLTPDPAGFAWRWRANDPDTITHRLAIEAADLLTASSLARVHVCPGENCGWLFLDTSRAGRRLWCSEETCGTRNRVRRWRARAGSRSTARADREQLVRREGVER